MGTCSVFPFRKARATNSTATDFTAKNATTTKPSGTGVWDLISGDDRVTFGHEIPKFVNLVPYGVGADTTTFALRLWGWNRLAPPGTADADLIWIPQLILELAVTLSTPTATPIGASNVFADTIAVTDGPEAAGGWRDLISPASDTPASILIHTRGCEILEFDFDMTGATSGNCLWRFMHDN